MISCMGLLLSGKSMVISYFNLILGFKGTGCKIKLKDRDRLSGEMETNTKGNGKMIK